MTRKARLSRYAGKRWMPAGLMIKKRMGEPVSKVKVAHIIWSLGLGGAEQVVLSLVRNLDRARFEPIVICLDEKGCFASAAEEKGVRVLELRKSRGADLTVPLRLSGLLREEKIGLVHTHLFNGHLWGRLAALLAGLPVVSTEHGMDAWRTPLHHGLDAVLTLKNASMVFVSEEARKFYRSRVPAPWAKDRVIYNGIETNRFENPDSREAVRAEFCFDPADKIIGTAGRFVAEKRHDVFLDALKLLREQGVPAKGLLVGDGPLKEKVQGWILEKGLSEFVVMAGMRQDLPRVYPAMDVFMLSSDREGMPITILEAMASGVPVVSTNVGGISTCIENGRSGWLVPSGDALALSRALQEVLEPGEKREAVIREARLDVTKKFSVEAMVTNYQGLYEEVLKS